MGRKRGLGLYRINGLISRPMAQGNLSEPLGELYDVSFLICHFSAVFPREARAWNGVTKIEHSFHCGLRNHKGYQDSDLTRCNGNFNGYCNFRRNAPKRTSSDFCCFRVHNIQAPYFVTENESGTKTNVTLTLSNSSVIYCTFTTQYDWLLQYIYHVMGAIS